MHNISSPAPIDTSVEQLLTSLAGVISAHVVTEAAGDLREIHILAAAGQHPKQVVRNVESALSAGLGIEIDRRIVSVAQLRADAVAEAELAVAPPHPAAHTATHGAGVPPATAAPPAAAAPASNGAAPARSRTPRPRRDRRGLILAGYDTRLDGSRQASCRVSLRAGPDEFLGEGRGPDTRRGRAEAAARAVFAALAAGKNGTGFDLEGVAIVDINGKSLVLVAARGLQDRRPIALTGAALLGHSPEEATIMASLQALNRWQPLSR